MLHIQHN